MTNPLVTTEEVITADLLATVEGSEYRAVSVVYKINGAGSPSFYCSLADWPKTEAGRMAAYIEEIERLKREILLLKSRPVPAKSRLVLTYSF